MKRNILAIAMAISASAYAVPAQAAHTSVVIKPSIASSESSIGSSFWIWLDEIMHAHG